MLLRIKLTGLLAADRAAEDEIELAGHFPAKQGDVAHRAAEAVVFGVPVVILQRDPLLLGMNVLAACSTSLKFGNRLIKDTEKHRFNYLSVLSLITEQAMRL